MTSTARIWTGRIASTLPVLMLVLSAGMKLSHDTQVVAMFSGHFGYPAGLLTALAVLELGCTALYVVPRTSVIGAVLLTGYLGGAISTHVRVDEPFVAPLVLGLLVWGGLYLRDARLRALLPLRTPEPVRQAWSPSDVYGVALSGDAATVFADTLSPVYRERRPSTAPTPPSAQAPPHRIVSR